jgi:hypothetical protein
VCVCVCVCVCVRESSVGIATDYGLDGPGGAHPASCKMCTGSFPGVKCGRGVLLTTHPFWSRGHGRVELHHYPPSGLHRACNGITLLLYIYTYIHFCKTIKYTLDKQNTYETLCLHHNEILGKVEENRVFSTEDTE